MYNINHCSYEIIKILLKARTPISTFKIASQLDISRRVILYNLKYVDQWLNENNIILVKKPHYGIYLNISEEDRQSISNKLKKQMINSIYLSPTERVQIIILSLFVSDDPILIKDLVFLLNVSKSTILKDIDRVESWLASYNLDLVRRQHYGFKIKGSEKDWRIAIVDFLLDFFGTIPLLELCKGSKERFNLSIKNKGIPDNKYLNILENFEWNFSKQFVDEISYNLGHDFTDDSYITLIINIAIMIDRIKKGRIIDLELDIHKRIENSKEWKIIKNSIHKIESHIIYEVPFMEKAYLTTQILSSKFGVSLQNFEENNSIETDFPEVLEVVNNILSEASTYLYPSLKVDQYLKKSLLLHFSSALNRLNYGFAIQNPLLSEVKKQYPYIFKIALRSVVPLEQQLGRKIPEEEVGFIAMYLGAAMERLSAITKTRFKAWVVCGEGIATAWLLVSKIRSEFPEIEIVEVMSLMEASQKLETFCDADLIISTVPFETKIIPVITVKALITKEDKIQIGEYLKKCFGNRSTQSIDIKNENITLIDLIKPETIKLNVIASSWQEVVEKAGTPLIENGSIEPHYVTAIKEVIYKYGPYMVIAPGVILLHANPNDGVNQVCMSLISLKSSVNFGQTNDCLVDLVFTLGAIDNTSHLTALSQLAAIVDDPPKLQFLRSASFKSSIINLIRTYQKSIRLAQ
jgi:transcriptional antiterminator